MLHSSILTIRLFAYTLVEKEIRIVEILEKPREKRVTIR